MKPILSAAGAILLFSCAPDIAPDLSESMPDAIEEPGPSTVLGIHHVMMSVSDLDEALAFYQGATEFELVERGVLAPSAALDETAGIADLAGEHAMLRGPNGQIDLVEFDQANRSKAEPVPVNGPGATHICFQSPKDRPLYDRFRERGADPVTRGGEPVDMLGRNYFYMYSRNPDGVMLEVEHATEPNFTEDVWLGHIAYATPDIDRLAEFYSALIGRPPYRMARDVSGPTFDQVAGVDNVNFDGGWISAGNMIVEMWEYHNPPTVPSESPRPVTAVGYSAVVFEVSNIANDLRRIKAAGGDIISAVEDAGDRQIAYARDVDGNLIGLIQFEKGSEQSVTNLKQIDWSLN